jgi:hypothetical protein
MSWETQAWAGRQRPGSASAKLVLLGLASCADANHCAFPSIQWLCDFSDLNRKTVIAALQRLEGGMFPLIEDTGERRGRTCQVKVYRLAAGAEGARIDPASEGIAPRPAPKNRGAETVPKAEQFQKRNSSGSSRKQSQKRDTEPFLEPLPLSPPDGGDAPPLAENAENPDKDNQGEWTAPPIDRLGWKTAALVRQWPPGAWEAVCETFRLHWQAEGGAKGRKRLASLAALEAWAIRDHVKIMRDAKAGVSFVQLVPVLRGGTPNGSKPGPVEPVAAQAREDDRSQAVRRELRRTLGGVIYDQWFGAVALIGDAPGLVVIAPSEFQRAWIEDRFSPKILDAGRAVLGGGVRQVRFQVQDIRERAA